MLKGVMVMFVGMSKTFWGLRVCFFINLKIASKKLHQVTLFHTTVLEIHDVWLTMLRLLYFYKSIQKISLMFPKITTKTVYNGDHIKIARFQMSSQKTLPLWITNLLCSVFIELWPQSKQFIVCNCERYRGKSWNFCRFITNPQEFA